MLRKQNRQVERYLRRRQKLLAIRGVADALYQTDDDNDDVNEVASQGSDRNSSASEMAENIVGHNDVMDSNSDDISDAEGAAPKLEILNRQEASARSGDTSLYSQRSGSSNESSSDEGENPEVEEYVQKVLRQWARNDGAASMRKLDELLIRLLVVFPNLSKSYKTLLQTPRNIEVSEWEDGSLMWYKSIQKNLDSMDLQEYLRKNGRVVIDVNMDGLPLSKSSSLKFWPILGYLVGTENMPFTIGIYLGKKDPNDLYAYLYDFVPELDSLLREGYSINDVVYPFHVRHYILDVPAWAFVKCCVRHNAYCSCEKCCVHGEYIANRMTYMLT